MKNRKRFNALERRLGGITQKALTETLGRLERNGFVARRVISVVASCGEVFLHTARTRTAGVVLSALRLGRQTSTRHGASPEQLRFSPQREQPRQVRFHPSQSRQVGLCTPFATRLVITDQSASPGLQSVQTRIDDLVSTNTPVASVDEQSGQNREQQFAIGESGQITFRSWTRTF